MRWANRIASFLLLPVLVLAAYVGYEVRAARKAEAEEAQVRVWELETASRALSQAVRRYEADNGRPPQTVDGLVEAGYLSRIPADLIEASFFDGMPRRPMYFDPAVPPPPGGRKPAANPAN